MTKNLKLATFMFKSIEYCSKAYNLRCGDSISVLQYMHQWDLKQKMTDGLEAPKVETMKNIVLHLKLMSGARGTPLAYVVWHLVSLAHILHGYSVQLTLEKMSMDRIPKWGKSMLV